MNWCSRDTILIIFNDLRWNVKYIILHIFQILQINFCSLSSVSHRCDDRLGGNVNYMNIMIFTLTMLKEVVNIWNSLRPIFIFEKISLNKYILFEFLYLTVRRINILIHIISRYNSIIISSEMNFLIHILNKGNVRYNYFLGDSFK